MQASKTDLSSVRHTHEKTAAGFFQRDVDRLTTRFEVRREVSSSVRHLKRHRQLVESGPATKRHPGYVIECPEIRDPAFVERPFLFRSTFGFNSVGFTFRSIP